MRPPKYRTAKVFGFSHDRARRFLRRVQRNGTRSLPSRLRTFYEAHGVTLAATFEAGLLALQREARQ